MMESEVVNFYAGKTIFVTGGTGFLGKVLIEKILYSCEDISKVYVLAREKKGLSAQERINQMFNTPAFYRLKRRPSCFSKIIALNGDITAEGLGLATDELQCLRDEVSIVFHLAASVSFDETLQEALDVNVAGTEELIKICQGMKKLQAFVYVSTAFSNADRTYIDEIVYPPPHGLEQARSIAKLYSDKNLINKFLGNKPNTYTYSKALAEYIVHNSSVNLPTAIIRPSIVTSSLSEPCPGWVDNWNGSTGLFVGVPSGVLKVVIGRGSNITDLVPVDIVTNLTIVAATRCRSRKALTIYNCCTGTSNPITSNEAKSIARRIALKHSLNDYPWPYLVFTKSRTFYSILNFLLQIIPAYLLDIWAWFRGKPMVHMKIQRKLSKMVYVLKFFLLYEWCFIDLNVRTLWRSLSKEDQAMFNFDVKSINWKTCLEDYVLGARKYLVNARNFIN